MIDLALQIPLTDFPKRVRDVLRKITGKRSPTYGEAIKFHHRDYMRFKNVKWGTVKFIQEHLDSVGLELVKG